MTENKMNKEELEAFAEYQGKKLALLVSSLKLSEEEKQAMIEMAAHASFDKLNKLVEHLEQQYLRETGESIDNALIDQLEKWQKYYADYDKQITDKSSADLDSIEKELDKFKDNEK